MAAARRGEEMKAAERGLQPAPPLGIERVDISPKHDEGVLKVSESYFCVPDLGQVPEINVPCQLPDMPASLMTSDTEPIWALALPPWPQAPFQSCLPPHRGGRAFLASPGSSQGSGGPLWWPGPSAAVHPLGLGHWQGQLRSIRERKVEKKKEKEREQGSSPVAVKATGQGGA